MTGEISGISRNMDGTWNLGFKVKDDPRQIWSKFQGTPVDVDVKKHRKKRSLDANNFCWALCSDIGKALRPPVSKEDVYRKAIRDVGVYEPLPIKEIALEAFKRRWEEKGTGWFVDVIDDSKLKGYKLVHAYYGSHSYDTKEMSILIDYLVDDAEQMGIPIPLGKKEIERLKGCWKCQC